MKGHVVRHRSRTSPRSPVFIAATAALQAPRSRPVVMPRKFVDIENLESRTLFAGSPTTADLSVVQTAPTTNVVAGSDYTYTVMVANNGVGVGQNVVVSDTIPTNTTFVSVTQTAGPAFSLSTPTKGQAGTVTATQVGLAAGASASFDIVVHLAAFVPAATVIPNSALVTTDSNDPNPANNSSNTTVTTTVASDVAVTLSSFRGNVVYEGQDLVYTITVTDLGPSDAQAVAFDFPVPNRSNFVSAKQTSGPMFAIVVSPAPPVPVNDVSGTIGTLAAGATSTFTIRVNVPFYNTITGTATATSSSFDPNLTNNSVTDSHDVQDAVLTTTEHPDLSAFAKKQITNVEVQSFTDANPNGFFGSYTSTIDWGDGTTASPGTQVQALNGTIYVLGTHTYAKSGVYFVHVATTDGPVKGTIIPSVADAFDAVTVGPPQLATAPSLNLQANENQSKNLTVGFFSDPTGLLAASKYSVQINWGDGTASVPGKLTSSGGGYNVSGTHTYAAYGNYIASFIVSGTNGLLGGTSADVTVNDPAVVATAKNLSVGPGVSTGVVTVATFTDPGGAESLSHYGATIDWGDGTASVGGLAAGSGGTFTVTGVHTYSVAGNQTVTTTVFHDVAPNAVVTGTAFVGTTPTPTPTPTGTLTAAGVSFSGVEGATLSNITVATFKSSNSSAKTTDFKASIKWGDNVTTTGTIASTGGGNFTVKGTHAYANAGKKFPVITITPVAGGSAATANSTATLSDAPLSAIPATFNATHGTTFNNYIGAFGDGNPLETNPANFTVSINWGDGNTTTSAVITYNKTTKHFDIGASHMFTVKATRNVAILVKDASGSSITIKSTANVA